MDLHLPIIDDSGNTVGDYNAAMGRGMVNIALDSSRFWIVNANGDYVQLDPGILTVNATSAVAASAPVLTDTGSGSGAAAAAAQTQAGAALPLATTITSGSATDTSSGALSILGAPSPVGGIPWWAVAGIALLLIAR